MNRNRDGLTRRQWLRAGLLGGVGLSLADLLRLEAAGNVDARARGKNAIFIFLDGGQAHMDSWDPKPDGGETAGEFKPIDTNLPGLIQAMGGCGQDLRGCEPRFGQDASRWLHGSVFVLALLVLGWRFTRPDVRPAPERDLPAARAAALISLLAAAVVLNALICGALSGAFPRYQGRIAWILAAAAAAAVAGALTSKPEPEA